LDGGCGCECVRSEWPFHQRHTSAPFNRSLLTRTLKVGERASHNCHWRYAVSRR
jgi:hypothetical protein